MLRLSDFCLLPSQSLINNYQQPASNLAIAEVHFYANICKSGLFLKLRIIVLDSERSLVSIRTFYWSLLKYAYSVCYPGYFNNWMISIIAIVFFLKAWNLYTPQVYEKICFFFLRYSPSQNISKILVTSIHF